MATGGVAAVERALAIIECFRESSGFLTLQEISDRTKLNKSTIIRLIVSLEKYGYMQRVGQGEYGVGPTFMHFGSVYQSSYSLAEHALPVLRRLMSDTGHSTALFVREGDSRICLHRIDSNAVLRTNIREGERRELLPGSSGKVILAFSRDEAERADWDDVRQRMYAINSEERRKDVSSIAAPIFRQDGSLAAAVTVSGPSSYFDAESVAVNRVLLLRACSLLTHRLGGDASVFARVLDEDQVAV